MAGLLVHPDLALLALGFALNHALDHLGVLGGYGVVRGANGEADGNGHLLNIFWKAEHTWMARETSVDKLLAVDFVTRRCEQDDMFTTPAEARGANGEVGALCGAQLLEKGLDNGERNAYAVVVDKRNEGIEQPESVVPGKAGGLELSWSVEAMVFLRLG